MSFFCDPYSFYDLFPNLPFDFTAPNCNEILTQSLAYSRDTPQHVQTPLQETLSTDTSSDLSPPTYALYPQCSLEEPQQQLFAPRQSDNQSQQLSSAHYARSFVQAPMMTRIGTEDGKKDGKIRKTARKDGKGYPCPECGKTFTSSSNLAVHAMIHTGMKPFKCELCPWAFRQKAHLQKHMRHIHKMMVAK